VAAPERVGDQSCSVVLDLVVHPAGKEGDGAAADDEHRDVLGAADVVDVC